MFLGEFGASPGNSPLLIGNSPLILGLSQISVGKVPECGENSWGWHRTPSSLLFVIGNTTNFFQALHDAGIKRL
jgi:hypothetical protein